MQRNKTPHPASALARLAGLHLALRRRRVARTKLEPHRRVLRREERHAALERVRVAHHQRRGRGGAWRPVPGERVPASRVRQPSACQCGQRRRSRSGGGGGVSGSGGGGGGSSSGGFSRHLVHRSLCRHLRPVGSLLGRRLGALCRRRLLRNAIGHHALLGPRGARVCRVLAAQRGAAGDVGVEEGENVLLRQHCHARRLQMIAPKHIRLPLDLLPVSVGLVVQPLWRLRQLRHHRPPRGLELRRPHPRQRAPPLPQEALGARVQVLRWRLVRLQDELHSQHVAQVPHARPDQVSERLLRPQLIEVGLAN
mmetsp:Transcript_28437/g.92142  ORF Transcript_28437/g.92142 Transcript_28437/m.92142 type:complete len:310 (-) Transcript_28437:965-1894(-)